jgi:dUTPase
MIMIIANYSSRDKYILHVCPNDGEHFLTNYYTNYKNKHLGDSGVDIMIPYNVSLNPQTYTNVEYLTKFVLTKNNYYKSYSYFLFARSSTSKYPLIFVNGVGIIDAGYRNTLSSIIFNPNNYTVELKQGDKIMQICSGDLEEIKVILNCDVPNYGTRGTNGFGSTSK